MTLPRPVGVEQLSTMRRAVDGAFRNFTREYGETIERMFDPHKIADPANIDFSLEINGLMRQQGNTRRLVFGIAEIIEYVSQHFGLQAGDLIYTGTPEGVGPLQHGDSAYRQVGGSDYR